MSARLHATRINEGQDLKRATADFAVQKGLNSGVIVSAVGSLSKARIRMAGAQADKQDIREYNGPFEVVSINGTVAQDGEMHVHLSIADKNGQVIGGHLKEGCIVHTTVELVISSDEQVQFIRKLDPATGFDELTIKEIGND